MTEVCGHFVHQQESTCIENVTDEELQVTHVGVRRYAFGPPVKVWLYT